MSFLTSNWRSDGVLSVELNKSEKMNAFCDELFNDFLQLFQSLASNSDVRVVVLTGGKSKHFTAGLDLQKSTFLDIAHSSLEPGRKSLQISNLVTRWQQAFTAIEECGKPVLVGIDGACVGAGVDLITACDIRFSTKNARFTIKEVDVGLAADLGSLQRLGKIIGNDSKLRELCYTARFFSAAEASELGLLSRVFETRDEMNAALFQLAKEIASKSPLAILGTKKGLVHARDHTVKEGLEFIATWNASMLQSEDVVISAQAQLSKTKPTFSKL